MPDCPKIKPLVCPKLPEKNCQPLQKLEVPPSIPDNMVLNVENGNVVDVDKNGVNFLMMYNNLRKAIKGL